MFQRHLQSAKHKETTRDMKYCRYSDPSGDFVMCLCGKRYYTQAANLCRHQKKCPEYQNYLKEKMTFLISIIKNVLQIKKEQTTTKPKRGRKKKSQPTPQEESDIESLLITPF